MKCKRITALITSAVLFLTLTACSKEHRKGSTLEVDLSTSYACEEFTMKGSKLSPVCTAGEGLVMSFYPRNYQPPRYYYYEPAADTFTEFLTDTVGTVGCAAQLPDGNLALLYDVETGRKGGSSVFDGKTRTIEIFDSSMHHIESQPLPDSVPETVLSQARMAMDGNGNWLLFAVTEDGMFDNAYVLNPDFTVKGTLDIDFYLPDALVRGKSGALYALSSTGEDGRQIFRIDCNAMTCERFDSVVPVSTLHWIMDGSEYEFYYSTADSIFGVNEDGTSELVVDFWNSDLVGNIWDASSLGDGSFLVDYNEDGTNQFGYYRLSPRSEEEISSTTLVSLAGVQVDRQLVLDVATYNQSQEEYRIVIKDYGREMLRNTTDPDVLAEVEQAAMEWRDPDVDYSAAVEQFKSDLLGGTVPDIVCLDGMPYQQLSNKGLLTDLAPMLAEDENFDETAYYMNILDGLKKGDKLERIGFSFTIDTALAKTEHVGEQQGRSPEEYMKMLQSIPEGMRILPDPSQEIMLYMFLINGQGSFIDRGTMKCSFDSQSFVDLLTLINTFQPSELLTTNDEEYWEMMEYGWNYAEDHTLLDTIWLSKPISYHEEHYLTFNREDVTLVGYPESCGGNGGMYTMNYTIALTSQSDKTEPVWAFIMDELGKKKQSKMCKDTWGDANSLPLMREPMHNSLLAATRGVRDGGNMTEDEMAVLSDYIEGLRMYKDIDPTISGIIYEESGKYFAGDTDAQGAANAIQSRVTLYLSEQS